MTTINQAIKYCEEMAKTQDSILYEQCRRILMMSNLPQWTEAERWNAAFEEADIATYPTLSKIAGMRLS